MQTQINIWAALGPCLEAAHFLGPQPASRPQASATGRSRLPPPRLPREAVDMGRAFWVSHGKLTSGLAEGRFLGPTAGASWRVTEDQGAHRGLRAFWGLLRDCFQLFGRNIRPFWGPASSCAHTPPSPSSWEAVYKSLQDCSPRGRFPAPFGVYGVGPFLAGFAFR